MVRVYKRRKTVFPEDHEFVVLLEVNAVAEPAREGAQGYPYGEPGVRVPPAERPVVRGREALQEVLSVGRSPWIMDRPRLWGLPDLWALPIPLGRLRPRLSGAIAEVVGPLAETCSNLVEIGQGRSRG